MQSDRRWIKYYPEGVDPDIEIEQRSLNEFLDQAAEKFHDNIAIEYNEKQWSYIETQRIVKQLAGVLYGKGLQKGDRLSIMLPNCPQYIFASFAVVRLGGILVHTNPMYVERELIYQLKDTQSKYIICHDTVYEKVKSIQEQTSIETIIVVKENEEITIADEDVYFHNLLKKRTEKAPHIPIDPSKDIASLQYTGGTTGFPKGVKLAHQNFINEVEQYYEFLFKHLEPLVDIEKRVVISFLPLYHIFGFANVTMLGFKFGYKQIILPRFEIETVLNLIKKEPPVIFYGVPTMYTAMLNYPNIDQYGLEHIKGFFVGSSPMPLEMLERFKKLIGKDAFISDGYGLTEATSGTIGNPIHRQKVGSVGIPVPRTEAIIAVETEEGIKEAPVGEKGEILIKGPQVMKGYWNNKEETAKTLRNGWLHTGDIGYMDEEGYFYVVDRKKDMIITGGFNVYPREVEEVIYQIAEVKEVIVIGVPDDYSGEFVKAYITLKDNQHITKDEIINYCTKHLTRYKVPRQIAFRDDLPKSNVGKLLKQTLREQEIK